ncbi:hypothetical protein [Streptomyces sp. NPDC093568]|uniref:hypothetical protein n=1 Tax=Streptomyces sp. NPDC093568 TaxID=3366041 RepID=UPI00381811CA
MFVPYRRLLFTEILDQPDAEAQSGRETRVVCLRRAITESKSKRLIRTLEPVDNPLAGEEKQEVAVPQQ